MKSTELRALCDEYVKRLQPFARIEVVEVAHEAFRDIGEKEKASAREAERILRVACNVNRQHLILLEEKGREFDSPEFAKYLSKLGEQGQTICFVLGGALGLHSSLTAGKQSISLSRLTYPHEMARMILLEQIYRASCIMSGKQYHY